MDASPHPPQSSSNFPPIVIPCAPGDVSDVAHESSAVFGVGETAPVNSPAAAVIEKEFDTYAAQYEAALNEGLSVSGEGAEYFAGQRIQWTAKAISMSTVDVQASGNVSIDSVLDFGCGVGIATPLLQTSLHPNSIWGFDPSSAAIDRANREFATDSTRFTCVSDDLPPNRFDLAYCNGVFHHIVPDERTSAFQIVIRSLKPGGWFAFWENNPWNPGTRYVMSKIPFDRDAVVISPREAKSLLGSAGFEIVRTDAWFLFPRSLSWLRPIEKLLYRLPLGAQYLVLARKPLVEAGHKLEI